MFKRGTLFIIGAGASCEFSLPSGDGLKERISESLNILFPNGFTQSGGDPIIVEALRYHASQTGDSDIRRYQHASWKIRDAMPQSLSIDNFLDAHQNDQHINLCEKISDCSSNNFGRKKKFAHARSDK